MQIGGTEETALIIGKTSRTTTGTCGRTAPGPDVIPGADRSVFRFTAGNALEYDDGAVERMDETRIREIE